MTQMTLRCDKLEDLPALLELFEHFYSYFDSIETGAGLLDKTKLERTLRQACFSEQPLFHCLISEQAGIAAGFASYQFGFWTDSCDAILVISALYSHSLGSGSQLMDKLTDIARSRGCGRIMWNVWDKNAKAIAFYQSRGAKLISDEPLMYIEL